jgi:pyrophosphatase PpaX
LFDLDGTLLDSHALIAAAFRHAGRVVLGRRFSDGEVMTRWGEPLQVRFAALAPDRVALLVDAYSAYYDAHHDRVCSLFPGVAEMLAALGARGRRLGVVTSKRRWSTAQAFQAFGLAQWIPVAISAEDVQAPKPAPAPVVEALRQLDASPEEALLVGDGVFDIQAARAAGVRSAAALWGTLERAALLAAAPDYTVETPGEVVPLVESG